MNITTVQEDSKKLDIRAYVNENFSKYSLEEWIISNLDLNKGDKVLDIGCGTGKQIPHYLEKIGPSGELYVVDSSEESINKVREKYGKDRRMHIFCSKMENIGEIINKRSFFNKIASTFAIYYTSTPEKTFKSIYSLLAKNGILFVSGPAENTNEELRDLQKSIGLNHTEDTSRWSVFLDKTAKKLMEENFGNVERSELINPISFPSSKMLVDYWRATPLYSKELDKKFSEKAESIFRENNVFVNNKVVIGLKSVKEQ